MRCVATLSFFLFSFLSGYVIQFLVIACFMWLTVMWIDICVHAWHYLPKGIKQTPQGDNIHLLYYCLFAFGVPLLLVILTYLHKFGGLPSYYLKGTTKGAFMCTKYIWWIEEEELRTDKEEKTRNSMISRAFSCFSVCCWCVGSLAVRNSNNTASTLFYCDTLNAFFPPYFSLFCHPFCYLYRICIKNWQILGQIPST